MLASILVYGLLAIAASTIVLWLAANAWTRRELMVLRLIAAESSNKSEEPSVSVVLPARNEENRILRDCVQSLLAQNYGNYEVVAVDDRSTDATARILRELASADKRLQTVEGAKLVRGWLGKPFALEQGLRRANGEWILTTDADILLTSAAIQTAMFVVAQNNLDALCLIPFVECETFCERVFIPTFNWFRMLAMPPSRVNDARRPETMGIGNFFLIHRRALAKINDFEQVKTEVVEDLRLAELLKQSGARIETRYAPGLLKTRMYSGLPEIWTGFTKNFFAGTNFSVLNAASGAISILLFGVAPVFLAIFFFAAWLAFKTQTFLWLFVLFAIVYFLQIALFTRLNREYAQPRVYALCAPLGLCLFAAILLNSMLKILSGSGVAWKDREIYRLDDAVRPPTKI